MPTSLALSGTPLAIVGTFPADTEVSIMSSDGTVVQAWQYDDAVEARDGHQHWVMWDTNDITAVQLGVTAFNGCIADARISGAVYISRWRATETSLGVYDFTNIIACLDRHRDVLHKPMKVRWTGKTYTGAGVYAVPQYILDDAATYGGTAPNGGVRAVNNGGAGWCPRYDNAAVMARIVAWMTAAHAAFGSHAAFAGFILDESAWSVSNPTVPGDLTGATVLSATTSLVTSLKSIWGSPLSVNVNYLDGNVDATVRTFRDSCVTLGIDLSYSDTYPMGGVPNTLHRFAQPVYFNQPADQVETLMFVDTLSITGTEAVDANADETVRMIQCRKQTKRMRVTKTIWSSLGGSVGTHWPHITAAIDATN